jgi:O-antigen ligase
MNMKQLLTTKSIFKNKQTAWLLVGFFALRILSYLLMNQPIIQAILVFGLIMAFGIIYFKETHYGWYIILGEMFLGGSGHFLEFFGLSIRTLLILTFMFLWILHHAFSKKYKWRLHIKHAIFYTFFPFIIFLILAAGIGIYNGNGFVQVVQDAIPFSYFILLLPFYHYFYKEHTQEYLVRLLFVFLLGSAIFALFTYILFTTGTAEVNISPYYTWFRDVAMGKITDMGNGFFRIVTPEHLLLVPGVLMISSLLMRNEKHNRYWYGFLALGMLILVFDFSRTYMLALAVGLLILKYKHKIKNWFRVSAMAMAIFLGLFFSINILSSGFTSTGLELLGVRIASLGNPAIETSAYTRMALLEPIGQLISKKPLIGNGLGASISFIVPDTYEYLTTTEFDWGYLELLAELGMLGFLSFLAILILTLYELMIKIESLSDYRDFYVGLLAGLVSLLVMTVTSPALFHVFGVFYLTIVLVLAMKPISIFERTLTLLYRVFNRLEK